MVKRVAERHPRYRQLLAEHGDGAASITSIADLQHVRVTTKGDFVADPERYLLEPDPDEPMDVLWDVAYTGGSTSRPTPIYQTAYDFHAILFAQQRMAEIRGLRPTDRIANLYPLTVQPHGAWLRAMFGTAALGASLVVGMSGAPSPFPVTRGLQEVVEQLIVAQPTVLWGVPSYLGRVIAAAAEAGRRLPSVRLLAVSGEPCPPDVVASLTGALTELGADAVTVSNSLGASELQCGLVECEPGAGFHNPAPELFHLAVVDEHGRPLADGDTGELCLTHLDRRGTVLLRYLVGDVVTLTTQPCPSCGRSGGRVVEHLGRSDAHVKVRGQLFDRNRLLAALDHLYGLDSYQVRVERDPQTGMDALVVRAAAAPGRYGVDDDIVEAVRAATGVRPTVALLPPEAIHDSHTQLKTVRFVDARRGGSTTEEVESE